MRKIARSTVARGAIGGFVTSVGGFVTMPVALPVNVVEFYVQATRMVAAIATLRGYDVNDPRVRTAVLLTLVGSDADEVLARPVSPRAVARSSAWPAGSCRRPGC